MRLRNNFIKHHPKHPQKEAGRKKVNLLADFNTQNIWQTRLKPLYLQPQKRRNLLKIYCGVEQLVARWAHNPKVVSSSLAPATRKPRNKILFFGFFYAQTQNSRRFC